TSGNESHHFASVESFCESDFARELTKFCWNLLGTWETPRRLTPSVPRLTVCIGSSQRLRFPLPLTRAIVLLTSEQHGRVRLRRRAHLNSPLNIHVFQSIHCATLSSFKRRLNE